MKSRLLHLFVLLVFLTGMLAVQPSIPVHAAATTWTVNTITDSIDGACTPSLCSLRDAITAATSGDTIKFNLSPAAIITLTNGELAINKDLTITGPTTTNLTVDGSSTGRVFNIGTSFTVSISGMIITHGHLSDENGAGILNDGNLTMDHVSITNNTVTSAISGFPRGGGIASNGTLTITNSTISGNDGYYEGGGIYFTGTSLSLTNVVIDSNSVSGGGDGAGLALYSGSPTNSNVTLDSITVSNNSAPQSAGIFNSNQATTSITNSTFSLNTATGGEGGAIFNFGPLTITNSTFSANSASNHGGGIYSSGGALSVNNSTFSGNSATNGGAGIYQDTSGTFGLSNTIFANSVTGSDCFSGVNLSPDDHNLIMSNSGCGTPVSNANPQLVALAQNDGLTKTMALSTTSPAVDAGNNSTCANVDQRGHSRPKNSGTGMGGICDIGAFELDNDDFNTPTLVNAVPYSVSENTTGFTFASDDPSMVLSPCNSDHGLASAWYSFTPPGSVAQTYVIDTFGSTYDTVMTVWTGSRGSLTPIVCNNTPDGVTGQAALSTSLTGGTTYYIEIIAFRAPAFQTPFGGVGGGTLDLHIVLNGSLTTVTIGGQVKGSYTIPQYGSMRPSYAGLNNGPEQVASTNGVNILASTRVIYGGASYSEMMGYPHNTTTDFWFPWYNDVAMSSQLRVSNLGSQSTTITVTIGNNQLLDSFSLAAGAAIRKEYAGVNNGPLHIASSLSVPILSTIRVLYGGTSYSEMMGYPHNTTTDFWFPWYNNVAMWSQLRVSNLGSQSTTITVTIGNNQQLDSFSLAAGAAIRKDYAGINNGPLHVTSSLSVPILSTIRVLFNGNSYSEMMGYPDNTTTDFWFPVYNNQALASQLRVSNIGSQSTTISVYLNNNLLDSFSLAAGAAIRKEYTGVNNGPLHVASSLSVPILSTVRTLYNGASFYEMMGYPGSQLTTTYWFPWYNNFAMDSQIRIAVP